MTKTIDCEGVLWINIEDELPTNKKPVCLALCDDGKIHKDIWFNYHDKNWMRKGPTSAHRVYGGKVISWLPKKEPLET